MLQSSSLALKGYGSELLLLFLWQHYNNIIIRMDCCANDAWDSTPFQSRYLSVIIIASTHWSQLNDCFPLGKKIRWNLKPVDRVAELTMDEHIGLMTDSLTLLRDPMNDWVQCSSCPTPESSCFFASLPNTFIIRLKDASRSVCKHCNRWCAFLPSLTTLQLCEDEASLSILHRSEDCIVTG